MHAPCTAHSWGADQDADVNPHGGDAPQEVAASDDDEKTDDLWVGR